MKVLIRIFGALLILSGISIIIQPNFIYGWIENNLDQSWLYITAIVARLIFGVTFIFAAKESNYPKVIKGLGFLFILAALILLFIGQQRFQNLIAALSSYINPYAIVSGLASIALGGFLIYAFGKNNHPNWR